MQWYLWVCQRELSSQIFQRRHALVSSVWKSSWVSLLQLAPYLPMQANMSMKHVHTENLLQRSQSDTCTSLCPDAICEAL